MSRSPRPAPGRPAAPVTATAEIVELPHSLEESLSYAHRRLQHAARVLSGAGLILHAAAVRAAAQDLADDFGLTPPDSPAGAA